jgi:hypothetical protein
LRPSEIVATALTTASGSTAVSGAQRVTRPAWRSTVLRPIRADRLKASRIVKSYRIRRSDLETFAGATPVEDSPVP